MRKPWWGLAGIIPPLGAALWLQFNWEFLPDRFPMHWTWSGRPDRWGEKTPIKVFFLPVLGAALALALTALASRRGTENAETQADVFWLTVFAWWIGLMFAILSAQPLYAGEEGWWWLAPAVLVVSALLAVTAWLQKWKGR